MSLPSPTALVTLFPSFRTSCILVGANTFKHRIDVCVYSPCSICSEFPNDRDRASCVVAYLGLTHFMTLGSTEQIPPSLNVKNRHLDIPKCGPEGLLLNLPDTCRQIQDAIDSDGRVLVYCLAESNAAIVVGAYCEPFIPLIACVLTIVTF